MSEIIFKKLIDSRRLMCLLQDQHADWARRNFGGAEDPRYDQRGSLIGAVEEFGELIEALDDAGDPHETHARELAKAPGRLAHATLKSHQGIRLSEDHTARAQDAIADITIYLIDLCTRHGWNYEEIVWRTWEQVRERDWTKNKTNGQKTATQVEPIP